MEKIVEIIPAFDERNNDPKGNRRIHGAALKFVLKGEKGAVQFLINTNWHLPHVQDELDKRTINTHHPHLLCHPLPANVGYHSPVSLHNEHEIVIDSCPYLDGKPCYYRFSMVQAKSLFEIMIAKGHEALWEELQKRYDNFANVTIKIKL